MTAPGSERAARQQEDQPKSAGRLLEVLAGVLVLVVVAALALVLRSEPEEIWAATSLGTADGRGITSTHAPESLDRIRWRKDIERWSHTSYMGPGTLVDGTLVLRIGGGWGGVRDDRLAWHLPVDLPGAGGRMPPMDSLQIAVGDELVRIDPLDGTIADRRPLPGPRVPYPVLTLPAGDEAILVFAGAELRALDLDTDTVRWTLDSPGPQLVGVTPDGVVTRPGSRFVTYDLDTGEEIASWASTTGGWDQTAAEPLLLGRLVVTLADFGHRLEAVDSTTGQTAWSLPLSDRVTEVAGPDTDGTIALHVSGDDAGTLLRVDGRTGSTLDAAQLASGAVTGLAIAPSGVAVARDDRVDWHPAGRLADVAWTVAADLTERPWPPITAAHDRLLLPRPGRVDIIDLADGRRTGSLPNQLSTWRFPGIIATTTTGDRLLVTDRPGTTVRRLADGLVLWQADNVAAVAALPDAIAVLDPANPPSPGTVRLVSLEDGTTRWEAPREGPPRAPVLLPAGDRHLLTTELVSGVVPTTRVVVSATDDGRELETIELEGIVADAAAADGGAVLRLSSPDGRHRLVLVQARPDGPDIVWSAPVDDPHGDLALTDTSVISANPTSVVVLDRVDGSVRWRHDTDRAVRPGLVVQGGQVIVPHGVRGLLALTLDDGRRLWEYEHPSAWVTSPTGAGGAVHAVDSEGKIVAVIDGDATVLTELPGGMIPRTSLLTTSDSMVFATDEELVVLGP